ncbi:uncharacterized protein LOC133733529 [Rosa rugosa]|uniref:uncharacterized protein LOC133733529 n=1 Tax=Rosa rugosa TaxID=74645 RepID=UPI002B414C44|nr:uncharacterized protein LOC133733529 [Rosa rugosa]
MKEEEEQEERWSKGLPEHILQLIPQRLCILDYQLFRQVCPNWRAAVDIGIATKTCPPAPQLPWLLFRGSYDCLRAFYINDQYSCVRDPKFFRSINIADYPPGPPNLEDESYDGPLPIPTASITCLGSIGSWLIVAAHQQCENDNSTTIVNLLLNPVSRVRVMLPLQSTLKTSFSGNTTMLFKKIVASSPPAPTTGLQKEDCLLAGLVHSGILTFCRPNDTSWTLIDPDTTPRFSDIEIFDGKLYAVTNSGNELLMVFDMAPEDANVSRANRFLSICWIPYQYLPGSEWGYPCLAKDSASKELFMVLRQRNIEEGFKVYKTDGLHGRMWEPVTDLGDRILFLSDKSTNVINDKTLGKNCIYFAFTCKGGYDGGFGVYSLKDSSIYYTAIWPS